MTNGTREMLPCPARLPLEDGRELACGRPRHGGALLTQHRRHEWAQIFAPRKYAGEVVVRWEEEPMEAKR